MPDTDDELFQAFLRQVADAPAEAPSDADGLGLAVGDRVADRYRVRRLLGRGGMGAVFEAADERSGESVALKVLRPELADDGELAARFRREALAARMLDHPGIVRVLDFGLHGERGYLVMELLTGETFAARLRAERAVSAGDAMEVIGPVIEALAAAHERGVVHRDVKPENVFLARSPSGAVTVKVLDFGVAKLELPGQERLTRTGRGSPGTPVYMAPEQLGHEEVGPAADQYAVATMLYEALSGRRPHEGRTLQALVVAKTSAPPRALHGLRPDLSAAFCAAVMRALAPRPEDRHASMTAFARALATEGSAPAI